MEVKVYATLRDIVGGKSVYLDDYSDITVGQMLQELFIKHPHLRPKLLDSEGNLHSTFQILVNGRDARYINGMDTMVAAKDEVRIFPPVGGGF